MKSTARTSLRSKLQWLTVISVVAVVAIIGLTLIGKAALDRRSADVAQEKALIESSKGQVARLLPVILLPEQKPARSLILNQIQSSENLDEIQIFDSKEEIPQKFRQCRFALEASSCKKTDNQHITITQAIGTEAGTFGYLVKTRNPKKNQPPVAPWLGLDLLVITAAVLFLALFFSVTRVTSREVPRELDAIIKWIGMENSPRPTLEFEEFEQLADQIGRILLEKQTAASKARLAELAAQVSHDIRSPLSALNLALDSLHTIPDQHKTLIRSATTRINNIANELLSYSKRQKISNLAVCEENSTSTTRVMLAAFLEKLVNEKRMEFKNRSDVTINYDFANAYGQFVNVDTTALSNAFSNLINNSVQAGTNGVEIELRLKKHLGDSILTISDNGQGMTTETLLRIGRQGYTTKSENRCAGSGLGVYHASQAISASGGQLSYESTLGRGTQATIALPYSEPPPWFLKQINLKDIHQVVVLDDDSSMHEAWRAKFSSLPQAPQFVAFSHRNELAEWTAKSNDSNVLFLVDYHLGRTCADGLSVVHELNLSTKSVLVTSAFDEREVQTRAQSMGMRVLPKSMVSCVPIVS